MPIQSASGQQKTRAPKTSAAGKCLTTMDLPSAAGEPSPPDASHHGLNFERLHRHTEPMNQLWSSMRSAAFRARVEFVARAHREDPSIFVTIIWSQSLNKLRVS